MSWNEIHGYGRFGLGILVGFAILAALWYGSGYIESTTPEEMSARIYSVYLGAAGFMAISLIAIVNRIVPVFYQGSRQIVPSFFINGLVVSVAINGIYLIIAGVTKIPYLGD